MSKLSKSLIVTAIFIAGAILGYMFFAIEQTFAELGRPVVRQDISSERLRSYGVPFDRPPTALNVVTAALSNGLGDVVHYVGLQMPRADATLLIEKLKSKGVLKRDDSPGVMSYLDTVPASISARLWPLPERQGVEFYVYQHGNLAYDPKSGELFVSTIPHP